MIQSFYDSKDTKKLQEFINNILKHEKLTHWPVHIWGCRNEGICGDTIRFGLCETPRQTKALFLHEVAHAILNPKRSCYGKDWHPDSYWHRTVWKDEFKRLCKEYKITLKPADRMTHYLEEGDR